MKTLSSIRLVLVLSSVPLVALGASSSEPITHMSSQLSQTSESQTSPRLDHFVSGKGSMMLQLWTVGNQVAGPRDQNIRLRRAEIKLVGTLLERPRYVIMVDPSRLIPAPGANSVAPSMMIQDLFVSQTLVSGLDLTVGQFKIPTTAEGLDASAELPLPERSVIGRRFGDLREIGIKLGYKTAFWNAATMASAGRSVAVDSNAPLFRDLDSRFEVTPSKDWSVGTFGVIGNGLDYSRKGRIGVNARTLWHQFVLRAEYGQGFDLGVASQGVTTEAGYWITEDLEPMIRYETFAVTGASGAAPLGRAGTVGVNYYLRKLNMKLQLSGSALENLAAPNGTPIYSVGSTNREIVLAMQTAI